MSGGVAMDTILSDKTAVIILAGGSGRRFGSDKLMEKIGGVTVIERSLFAFQYCDAVSDIVLVARPDSIDILREICKTDKINKLAAVVPGGDTRALSCMAGLEALPDGVSLVAVHDGARPLVTDEVINNALEMAWEYGAAVPAVTVKDTIKICAADIVKSTPDRTTLAAVQTPQCFRRDIICGAMQKVIADNAAITDDASAVEYAGGTVRLSAGSEENIKITMRSDIALAEMILKGRKSL